MAPLVGTGGNVRPSPYNERPRVVRPGLFEKECQDHAPTLTGTCSLYHRWATTRGPVAEKRIPKRGFIYLALAERSGGIYKIGRTRDLVARLSTLNGGSPLPIRIVHSVCSADYTLAEREIQNRFAAHRDHGEWFRFCGPCAEKVMRSMDQWAVE